MAQASAQRRANATSRAGARVDSRTVTQRFSFGPLRSSADLEALANHESLAFNTPRDSCLSWLRATRDDVRVARAGSEVVGGLVRYDMGQFFGGRSVRNIGIAGVAISPTARGRGAAKSLMAATLNELHDAGVAVSTLYPTTFTLYGRAGYAVAGHRYRYKLPLAKLGRVTATGELCRLDPGADAEQLSRLYRRLAMNRPGWLDRNEHIWERVHKHPAGRDVHRYTIPGQDGLDGYVVYTLGEVARYPYGLEIRDVQAANREAARRILALFSDCRTLARHATWYGGLDDSLLLEAPEVGTEISVAETWMLRIVDIVAAFTERGYPRGPSARLEVDVTDDVVSPNQGRWIVEIEHGAADVRRASGEAGPDVLQMDIRALASLYTGHLSARRLAELGSVQGSAVALDRAERIFAGPPPAMPDYF